MRREKQIHLRVTEKEAKRLARVARHHKLGVSAMIRMLVKREASAIKRTAEENANIAAIEHAAKDAAASAKRLSQKARR